MLNAWQIFQSYKTVAKSAALTICGLSITTRRMRVYKREEMPQLVAELMPRVTAMEMAHRTDNFPPKPGGLCYEYCDVMTCEFHGKRPRR